MMGGSKQLAVLMLAATAAGSLPFAALRAQTVQPAPPAQAEHDVSKDCSTPGVEISGNFPLPHMMQALNARKRIRILAIGSSAMSSQDTLQRPGAERIESLLETAVPGLDVQIVNRGVSGELAAQTSRRIKAEVALTRPDLVLWQVGTSDALARIPVDEFASNVDETLTWLGNHGVDVVLVGLHYIKSLAHDPEYQQIRNTLKDISERHKVLRIGRYEAEQIIAQASAAGSGQVSNNFELTQAGNACLAEYVTRALASRIFARGNGRPLTP